MEPGTWDPDDIPDGLPSAVATRTDLDADDFSESERAILWYLECEVNSVPGFIAKQTDLAAGTVKNALYDLRRHGLVENPYRGLFRLPRD